MQLAKFCTVGATGYVVNLGVYTLLLKRRRAPLPARGGRLVPRRRDEQLHLEPALDVPRPARPRRLPGAALPRRLDVALAANLVVLHLLVQLGVGKVLAQAIAIVLVTPLNFMGNKLWSFGRR